MDEKKLQEELESLQEYLSEYGKTAEFYIRMAGLLSVIGEYHQAEEDLKCALLMQPDNADAWFLLGQCCLNQNRLQDGLSALGRAARLLRTSGCREEFEELTESVAHLEELSQCSLDFFNAVVESKQHTVVLIASIPFSGSGSDRQNSLAAAFCRLGHTVIYINPANGNRRQALGGQGEKLLRRAGS